ncbi:hypothetical protein Ancab_016480 [Ancistrocladus abbreviatus]
MLITPLLVVGFEDSVLHGGDGCAIAGAVSASIGGNGGCIGALRVDFELHMSFTTSILHVHLMQWDDLNLVEKTVVKCDEVQESLELIKSMGIACRYKSQNVAVKIVPRGETPEQIARREARFAREVAMLSKVQHKNLVKFIGACKEPVMVIVTKLLLGGTLLKYLINMRPRCLDTRVAIGFVVDIARAMECLHSHGIIHRDLKPENLILTADHRTVKLADFGLARKESLTEMMTAETGTYRWMAPELYSTVTLRQGEKKHYNNKVDAYSFAIVLWKLIHNKLPFEGMSNLQAAYAAAFKVSILSSSSVSYLTI